MSDVDDESTGGGAVKIFGEFGKWLWAGGDTHVSGDQVPSRKNICRERCVAGPK